MRSKNFIAGIVGLALLALSSIANATVLAADGEDTGTLFIGSITVDTTSGHFRSGYAREALLANCNGGNDPPTCRIYFPQTPFTPTQNIWFHAETFAAPSAVASGYEPVCAITADGVPRLCIWGNGSGQTTIASRSSGGAFTVLQTCIIGGFPVAGALAQMDFHVNFSTTGSADLYSNGVDVCSYSGDVTGGSGQTQIEQFYLYNVAASGVGGQVDWSEEVASTTDTRSEGVFTCAPTGAGVNQTWTGPYTSVNPTTINDANQVYTATSSNISEWTCGSLPSGTFMIPAIAETVRLTVGSSGPQSFYDIVRPATGGTDYNNGSPVTATTSYENYYNIWPVNPATSSSWTPADLASGFNFGVESQP